MNKLTQKIKALPVGVKASGAYFLANVISSGIAYLATPIYTRVLSPVEYGQTSVFMTWQQVLGILAMFCLSYGVFNNGMLDHPDKRDEYSLSMLMLSNIITVVVAVFMVVGYLLFGDLFGVKLPYFAVMFAVFLLQPAYNFWTARQRYEYKYKHTALLTIFTAFFSPAVAITAILLFNNHRLDARIYGAELALIAVYVFFYVYLLVKGRFAIKIKYWKSAFFFNLPLIPHYLSFYLLTGADKIMIALLVNDSAVAFYSVAHSLASVIAILWNAINTSLIPYTYEKCKNNDYKSISKITLPILTAFAAVCLLAVLLAPEVISIMGTSDYLEAIYAIPPIVGGAYFQVNYYIYANIIYYHKKPKYVMFASVTAAIANLILNYIFIKQFGYLAAGYTSLLCFIIQATIDYFAMRRIVKLEVYNMKFIGLLSLSVVLFSVFSSFLYAIPFVRYGIFVLTLIIIFIYRNTLVTKFKELRNK